MDAVIAGILDKISEMTLFLNPLEIPMNVLDK